MLKKILITLFLGAIFVAVPASAYIVQTGDYLCGIGAKFGMSCEQIIGINPQIENPDLIFPNQEVNAPTEYTDDEKYWLARITDGDQFTEEELDEIPEAVWEAVTPQIFRLVKKAEDGMFGAGGFEQVTCRGRECDQYKDNEPLLGFSVATGYKTTLSSSMTSSQATVPASAMTTPDGTTLNMGLLGDRAFLTIEPGASKEEIVMVTGITGTTWTGATRGLGFTGTSTASVAANRKTHNAGSILIMSNVHYVYDELVDKDTDQVINGTLEVQSLTVSTTPYLLMGDDTTTANKTITANNGETNEPFLQYNEVQNAWQFSDDGINTTSMVTGGSGLSASTTAGIVITDSKIAINLWTDKGLQFDPTDGIGVKVNANTLYVDSNGIGVDTSQTFGWTGPNTHAGNEVFNGTVIDNATTTNNGITIGSMIASSALNAGETMNGYTDPVPVYIKRSDGELYKADASIENLQSGDVAGVVINSTSDGVSAILATDGYLSMSSVATSTTIASNIDQKFLTGGASFADANNVNDELAFTFRAGQNVGNVSSVLVKMINNGAISGNMTMDIFAADVDGKPTGLTLGTSGTVAAPGGGEADKTFTFSTPAEVYPGQTLVAVIEFSGVTFGGNSILFRGVQTKDGYSFVNEPAEKVWLNDAGSWAGETGTVYFTTYYTQEEYQMGDNLWLSATAGEFSPAKPASGVPMIKVGEMVSQTLMKADSSKKSKFLGSVSPADSGFVTVNIGIPTNTYEVVIDAKNEKGARDTRGQMVLRRNEVISQTIDDDDGAGTNTIVATWVDNEGNINITASDDIDVTVYFYSY